MAGGPCSLALVRDNWCSNCLVPFHFSTGFLMSGGGGGCCSSETKLVGFPLLSLTLASVNCSALVSMS